MTVEVGQKLTGKVTGVTKFGAFIDLGENKSGMVHISQISNEYVKDINDFVSVGDEVDVKVTKISDDGKIALSMKDENKKDYRQESNTTIKNKRTPFQQREPINNHKRSDYTSKSVTRSTDDFDTMMTNFLKDSDDRLASLKKNTEGKRGGRGGRRTR